MNRRHRALTALLIFSLLLLSSTAMAGEWVPAVSHQPGFWITDVAVSGDGLYGALTGDAGVILLAADGTELWRVPEGRFHSVSLSGNGSILAACGDGIVLLDKNSTVLGSVSSRNYVNDVSVTTDGGWIAAAVDDETLHLYTSAGDLVWSIDTGDDLVSVAISPDGTYIAGGTDTGNVVLFSNTGDERWTYGLSRQPVTSVAVADGARTIAAVSADGAFSLISRAGGLLWSGSAPHAGGVSVSADGVSASVADRQGIRFIERDGTLVGQITDVDASVAAGMDSGGDVMAVTDGIRFTGFTKADVVTPDVTKQPADAAGTTGTTFGGSLTPTPSEALSSAGETPVPTRSPFPLVPALAGLLLSAGLTAAGRRFGK